MFLVWFRSGNNLDGTEDNFTYVEFTSLKAHDTVPEEQVYFFLFMLILKY